MSDATIHLPRYSTATMLAVLVLCCHSLPAMVVVLLLLSPSVFHWKDLNTQHSNAKAHSSYKRVQAKMSTTNICIDDNPDMADISSLSMAPIEWANSHVGRRYGSISSLRSSQSSFDCLLQRQARPSVRWPPSSPFSSMEVFRQGHCTTQHRKPKQRRSKRFTVQTDFIGSFPSDDSLAAQEQPMLSDFDQTSPLPRPPTPILHRKPLPSRNTIGKRHSRSFLDVESADSTESELGISSAHYLGLQGGEVGCTSEPRRSITSANYQTRAYTVAPQAASEGRDTPVPSFARLILDSPVADLEGNIERALEDCDEDDSFSFSAAGRLLKR